MSVEKDALRQKMSSRFRSTRKQLNISQGKMAELLEIDLRSYSDLEHGTCLCSTPVFIRYLLINTTNVAELLKDLESVLDLG